MWSKLVYNHFSQIPRSLAKDQISMILSNTVNIRTQIFKIHNWQKFSKTKEWKLLNKKAAINRPTIHNKVGNILNRTFVFISCINSVIANLNFIFFLIISLGVLDLNHIIKQHDWCISRPMYWVYSSLILDLFVVIDRPVFHPQLSFDRILKSWSQNFQMFATAFLIFFRLSLFWFEKVNIPVTVFKIPQWKKKKGFSALLINWFITQSFKQSTLCEQAWNYLWIS